MKKARYDTASKRLTFTTVLGITVFIFLMLMSIVDTTQFEGIQNSTNNNVPNFNKVDKAIKV